MRIQPHTLTAATLAVTIFTTPAGLAYGGGSSSSSSRCTEPKFSNEIPAANTTLPSLAEISVIASDDTDITTLELDVAGQKLKPQTTQQRNGDWLIQAKLPQALTHPGKVRIALSAKSKFGEECSALYPYFLDIRQ